MPPGTTEIRTLLVDDNKRFLHTAAPLIATFRQVHIVGQASSGFEALRCVEQLHPDLVLMDLSMPGMDGLEATRRLKSQNAPPRVVILTVNDEDEYRTAAEAAGADGFVAKGQMGSALLPVVEKLFGS